MTPRTLALQAALSMGFSRQEYWSELPFPLPGDLPTPGIKSMSPVSPALAGRLFTTAAAASVKSLQSCPTLSDPMDCSPPGSSVHGIFQARVLEWGAIAFSDLPLSHLESPLLGGYYMLKSVLYVLSHLILIKHSVLQVLSLVFCL